MVMNKNIKEMGDGFYIVTEEGSNEMGGFCCHNVELRKHDDPSFCAEILRNQQFVNFPGLAHGKWEQDITMEHVIKENRFASFIYPFVDDRAVFSWTVQPDGRYWADEDGYGMTDDNQVTLYALFNKEGRFITLFSDQVPEQIK